MQTAYWLTNVLLESGYSYENDQIDSTETELCHILIDNGRVARIISNQTPIEDQFPKMDGKKLLLLPSFKEMHFHLDKTYYSGPWKAPKPAKNLIERLQLEAVELPKLIDTTKERAEKLIKMIMEAGSTHIRAQINVDPYVGLKNLEATREALEDFSDKLTWEIVAFPQHGLIRTQVKELMRMAMREGATIVGGVDPAGVDGNIERSLHQMMDIATEANANIDIHLHDAGPLGMFTMNQLADFAEEAGWQGRVAISHAFALGGVPTETVTEISERFTDLDISVITTGPIFHNYTIPPIPLLMEKGVKLAVGCNSVNDTWGPFGNADILERLGRMAECFVWNDERALAESLGLITGGIIPLDKDGTRIWPKPNDEASFVLVEATCSAEAIARRSKRHAIIHKGQLVGGNMGTVLVFS